MALPYFYPQRNYHQLNAVAYPDHSFKVPGDNEVLRSFWRKGEHMWDQDMNGNFQWLGYWIGFDIWHRWDNPRSIWYSPVSRIWMADPTKTNRGETADKPNAFVITAPGGELWFKTWKGVKAVAQADRMLVGRASAGLRGLAEFKEYVDEIEIAFYCSQTKQGRIIAMHRTKEPFRLKQTSYSSRLRNWPWFGSKQLEIEKNGVLVGRLIKSMFSSRLQMLADTVFNAGDVLAVRAPTYVNGGYTPRVRNAVCGSIVGELL